MRGGQISILGLVLSIATSVPACLQAAPQDNVPTSIIHVSFSPIDQWAQCVSRITGKSLILSLGAYRSLECPRSRAELNTGLRDKAVLVSGDRWDLLIGKGYLYPGKTRPEFWRNVTVKIDFRPWGRGISGSRQPTPVELKELGEKALEVIRPSLPVVEPIAPKREPGTEQPGDTTASFSLELLFDTHRLSPNGPESIIGLFRQSGGGAVDGRVIYGEYRDGKPVFLWDSPIIRGVAALAYRDVEGYGAQDIVLEAEPWCGNRSCAEALMVFTNHGEELTRQRVGDPDHSCVEGRACPIMGGDFHFIHEGAQLPERIEVEWYDQPKDVYALGSNNLFEKQPPAKSASVEDPAALNEQGVEFMKEKNYEAAAAKFAEAAYLNPKSAEYSNNAGFALYQTRKYEASVDWLKKAVGIDPKRAVAYVNLGDAYAKLKRNAEARQAYKKYLELAPDSKSAPDVKKKLEALPASP